jgi:hypothetical protein
VEATLRTIDEQVRAVKRAWPGFDIVELGHDRVVWFGWLAGIERQYRVMVEYGLPANSEDQPMWRRFPVVRVMSPALEPNFHAKEESPLPHVYFDDQDLTLSPLCLFDPRAGEWSHDDLIAHTTIPWAADWLACYEGWLATGRWYGGGRHATSAEEKGAA